MSSFDVALEALIYDADIWDQVSHVTKQASREADTLSLGEAELSFVAGSTGLLTTYAQIQQKVSTLLDEGSHATRDLSVALDQVNHTYRFSDQNAVDMLKGAWDADE